MNLVGLYTLLVKEVTRFRRVLLQTVVAPALGTLLYLVVFAHLLARRFEPATCVGYLPFLVPGLAMMSVLQNAFSNSSSSLMQSRLTGNLVFVLLAPLGPLEILAGYVLAAALRGLLVAGAIVLVARPFVALPLSHPALAVAFVVAGGALLGALGVVAGLHARKFDELAGFQNFVVVPLSFLSGAFYSVAALPPRWQVVSRLNPFFYAVDGCRYAFLGRSDAPPFFSLAATALAALLVSTLALALLSRGYRIRN